VGAIGRNRAMPLLPGGPIAVVGFGPPFGNQHLRVPWRQVKPIADGCILEVDAVDHVRKLPNEADGPKLI